MFKIGQKKKLLSPELGEYEVIDIIENPDITLDYDFFVAKCPHCGKDVKKQRTFVLKRVYVFKKGNLIGYKGETESGELVRFPDKTFYPEREEDMIKKVESKRGDK